ncbi:MAG: T9SS type A sorting domain-containing protein [Saprospiraceae bacterium]
MKILFTLLGVIGSCLLGIAQLPITPPPMCGQETTAAELELLIQQRADIQKHTVSFAKAPVSIPLTIHLVARSNQQDALTESQLNKTISELNTKFSSANVQFFTCGIHLIADDNYFDFNKALESEITQAHNVEGTLNLYFFNNIISGNGLICGYAYLPTADKDHILLTNDCVVNGTTHLHEMGHHLGLYHTHGKSNQVLTDELVDGSNCTSAGDEVCDTPADPNLADSVNDECIYSGHLSDANGDAYQPNPHNFMAYGNNDCRNFFTEGQYQRMAYFADQLRKKLTCSSFSVDFTVNKNVEHCQHDLTVQFTADIVHPNPSQLTYAWDINNDGKVDYETSKPQHTYAKAGIYSVSLIVSDGTQQVSAIKKDLIQLVPAITYDFTDSLETGIALWSVQNPDEAMTWGVDETSACTEKNGVVRFNNFNYNAIGQRDYLQSQRIDLRHFNSPQLTFQRAYAPYSNSYSDELAIQISTDCFTNDVRTIYQKKGQELATAEISTVVFQPQQCSDWQVDTIDLQPFNHTEVSIRFVNINGYGNYLYLDNISVNEQIVEPLSINDNSREMLDESNHSSVVQTETQVYPNPAKDQIWVVTPPHKSRLLTYQISNTEGQILQSEAREVEAEQPKFSVDVSELVAGVYFLQIVDNQQIKTRIFTIF